MTRMQAKSIKYIFLIQSEGRGHITQAIALSKILTNAGHEVSHVFIGSDPKRRVPACFHKKIIAGKTEFLSSPGFVLDKNRKGVRIWFTIVRSIANIPQFIRSLRRIHSIVQSEHPDILLNFYDPLGGLYNLIFRPRITYLCIGHQYLAHHQNFKFAKGFTDKLLFLLNNRITSIGAKKLLALSFSKYSKPKNKRLIVLPPLLRPEVFQKKCNHGGFILIYILNKGYGQEIIQWHKSNQEVKLHCFWDNQQVPETMKIHPNPIFHRLSDTKFLELMSQCKAYVSTAGFESICEAMYFGKPVMTVPVGCHYEQHCNSLDALVAGAGIKSNCFNISKLLDYLPNHCTDSNEFRKWVEGGSDAFLLELTRISNQEPVKQEIHPAHHPLTLPQHAH